jgi:hypothetical protein
MELNKSITLEAGNGMEGGKWSSPDNFVQEGNWYHFAYSINKATGAVRIHFNGESAAIELSDGASLSMDWTGMKTTGPFTFGSFIDGQYHFTGYIDDMRVYKRSLTDAEILNLAR